MSTTEAYEPAISESFSASEAEVYQSVSRAAVAAIILAILGLLSFWAAPLVALSILGVVFAFLGLRAIKKFPDELLGSKLATIGGTIALATAILAPTYHTIVYMTEVPDGYERLDFKLLKAQEKTEDRPPASALQYDGQKVFIKGYIHPASMENMLAKRFVLVPDLGTCCFGNQPPLTHMIEVSLTGDQYAKKGFRKQRLAGTLRVNQEKKPVDDLDGVFYQLRADIIK